METENQGSPSAEGANSFSHGFPKGSRERHAKKHLKKFPGLTAKEYEQRGLDLVQSPVGGDIEGYLAKNGTIIRYNRKTMELASGIPDKELRTFHKLGNNPDKAYRMYLEGKRLKEKHHD